MRLWAYIVFCNYQFKIPIVDTGSRKWFLVTYAPIICLLLLTPKLLHNDYAQIDQRLVV